MQKSIINPLLTYGQPDSDEEYENQVFLFSQGHLQLSSYFNLPQLRQNSNSPRKQGNCYSYPPQDENFPNAESIQTSKSQKGKQSKNKNLLKFIVKILRDYSETVKEVFGVQYSSDYSKLQRYISELFIQQKQSPKECNINSSHLKHILCAHQEGESSVTSLKVRQALSKILSKKMSKLVTKNNRCCQKLVYLNALKVYQLRCRSVKTALRLQSSL